MGRTTFEIILNLSGGKLLPERNIVIFSKTLTTPPHSEVKLCRSPYASFDILPKEDRMIAGGKSIYESCLPFIDEFIVSKIHGIFPADCYINESELLAKFVEDKEKSYVIREASDGKPLVTAHYYFRR